MISKYNDILLQLCDYDAINNRYKGNTDLKYDWFDYFMLTGNVAEIYKIIDKTEDVGYVAIYNIDMVNNNASIYAKISENKYYGTLLKSALSIMEYGFVNLKLNKLNFIYREDNYFYEDVCVSLGFVKEAIIRNQFVAEDKYVNLIHYGIIAHEYNRLSKSDFKRMFTWDYNYFPTNVVNININDKLNWRAFTNFISNPNNAVMSEDWREFAMNQRICDTNCLSYKDITFPVKIFDSEDDEDSFICRNQLIDVPKGQYKDVLLITTALFGCQDAYLKLIYDDGTSEEVRFTVSDWCQRIVRDEYVIHYASACRNLGGESNVVKGDCFLYLKRIPINNTKELCSIRFSDNWCVFVFAVALVI